MIGWIFVILLCGLFGYNLYRTGHVQRLIAIRQRRPSARPTGAIAPTLRARDLRTQRSWAVRIRDEVQSRGNMGVVIFFLIILIAFFLSLNLLGFWGSQPTETVRARVILSPFTSSAGQPAQEGFAAATTMAQAWQARANDLQFAVLKTPIADAQSAWNLADRPKYDLVIWGTIVAGGDANSASIEPQLLWTPRQPLPHDRSLGLRERLSLPLVYRLADQPFNAQAVLGEILVVIDLYQMGEYDQAIQAINSLLDRYAVDGPLRPDLLLGIRGSIAALQEQWSLAEGDFRRALETADKPEYWNNLGVVLLEQGRFSEATQAFNTAQERLKGTNSDLTALHLNRGLLALRGVDPAVAVGELALAVKLNPNGISNKLALVEAQLQANQLAQAIETINNLNGYANADPLVQLMTARVQVAQLVNNGDQPLWELEIVPPLPRETLTIVRQRLDSAVVTLETISIEQRQIAARDDAAGLPESGRVHEAHSRQAFELLNQVRYWQAVAMTEEGISASLEQKGRLRSMWDGMFGDDSPLELAQNVIDPLAKAQDQNYPILIQAGRVHRILGAPKTAMDYYTKASELNANRPEGWYGLAITRFNTEGPSPERNQAVRDYLQKTIAAAPNFTPGYILAARLEVSDKQWAAALPYLQWIVANRPDNLGARITLGTAQRELGALADAEVTLLPLANANNSQALVELGKVYAQAGQDQSAEDIFLRALNVDSSNASAAYEIGRLRQNRGDYAGAEKAYQVATEINTSYVEAHLALGQLYARYLDQPDNAVAAYQRAIDAGGEDPRNFEDMGREFLEIGRYSEAADALEQSVRLNPNVPESRHYLAQAYLEQGRFEAAREQERAAIARDADGVYIEAQLGIAESFRRERRFDEAITAYNEILDNDSTIIPAYIGLGRTAADRGEWQVAIGYYNQALAREPNSTNAHFWLGQALVEQGFYERALDEFNLVLATDPNNAEALFGAGRAYCNMAINSYAYDPAQAAEYDAEARRLLDRALNYRPNDARALFERGKLNERQNQMAAAISDYGRAAQLDAQNSEALYLQGKLYLSQNNLQAAEEALDQSVRRNQNDPTALYWLGRTYRAQNRTNDAIKSFERALSLNGNFHEARYYQGLTAEEANQIDLAREAYHLISQQASPDDRWRLQAEERLRDLGQ
ncbi:MAG TPA: tetratricopeptide repeat protein [Herpetosiphon sp.]|uniref:TPR repeat-containing protein n=1 Tax=Herpetosiphon aurantiacus (strain ATCC 23779 / DSM 785 / 114-95) TaxID=316274 RepID=A9B3W9_HERA2|nr:tetratricopeptide repeat protein [Herpetosiphon sp.]ABX06105.1 TPR repeat-containing protein [Herpetosiphon aurantiacus DSM 785]HBW50119.1 tetratricopeptide repeat protein [Herpetosiphon sp.]